MRAFPDDPEPSDRESDANGGGEASSGGGRPNASSAPKAEGQLFDQW